VILPLCRPALGVIGVFGFTMVWDQYLLPLIVAREPSRFTLPIALRTLRADDQVGLGVLLAASLLALLPSVIAFLLFQLQFTRGVSLEGLAPEVCVRRVPTRLGTGGRGRYVIGTDGFLSLAGEY
jgi:ABC-type glycerol-3-phosphate transport system permease component